MPDWRPKSRVMKEAWCPSEREGMSWDMGNILLPSLEAGIWEDFVFLFRLWRWSQEQDQVFVRRVLFLRKNVAG